MKDCYVARSRTVAARLLGEEMIIMSAVDSTLFNLNPVATLIWQSADGKTPLTKIVEEKICPVFEVAQDEALRDAEEFVSELAAHGILLLADAPMPDPNASPDKLP